MASIPVIEKLRFHITYDSHDDFRVVTKEDITVIFPTNKQGIVIYQPSNEEHSVALVQTVRKSFQGYIRSTKS